MSPEHSGGLDDAELPARTAAGETRFERLRRIILFSGTLSAPSASDETGGTLGDGEALPVSFRPAAANQQRRRGGGGGSGDEANLGVCEAPARLRRERATLAQTQQS